MRSLTVLVLVLYFLCLNSVFGYGHSNQEVNPRSFFSFGSSSSKTLPWLCQQLKNLLKKIPGLGNITSRLLSFSSNNNNEKLSIGWICEQVVDAMTKPSVDTRRSNSPSSNNLQAMQNSRSLSYGSNIGFRKPLKRGEYKRPPFDNEYDSDYDDKHDAWDDDDDMEDRNPYVFGRGPYDVGPPRFKRPKLRFPTIPQRNPAQYFEHSSVRQRIPLMYPSSRSRSSDHDFFSTAENEESNEDGFRERFAYDWSFPDFSAPIPSFRRESTRHVHHDQLTGSKGARQMQAEDTSSAVEKPPVSGDFFASRRSPAENMAALESALDEKPSTEHSLTSRLAMAAENMGSTANAAEELPAGGRSAGAANADATSRNDNDRVFNGDAASAHEQMSAVDPSSRRNFGPYPNYNGNNIKYIENSGNPNRYPSNTWQPSQQNGIRPQNPVLIPPPEGYEARPVINAAFRGRIVSYTAYPSMRQPHRLRFLTLFPPRSLTGRSENGKNTRSNSMDPFSSPYAMMNQNPYQSSAGNMYGNQPNQGMMYPSQSGHSHNRPRYPSSQFESGMSPHLQQSPYSQSGTASQYMQTGASSAYSQPGMSGAYPLPSPYSQAGVSQPSSLSPSSAFSSGMSPAYSQSDTSNMYLQTGFSSPYSAHGLPIKRYSKET